LVIVAVTQSTLIPKVSAEAGKEMVCYYGTWAVYRPGAGKFDVENIDPTLCTQIVYGFVGLGNDNKIRVLDAWNDLYDNWGKGAMARFVGLKSQNPTLKALVAIGGWNEGSTKYSNMAATAVSRQIFVQSAVNFLQTHGFDGLDMDWEYPANRGGIAEDRENFITLLRELKEAFAPYGFMLTAAVSCGKGTVDTAYDIPAMSMYLDFINLMCYDMHGAWETFTGHNSPLYVNPKIDTGDSLFFNVDYAVNMWLDRGAPASKLTLGMPLYGRGFTLNSATNNGLYAPANQPLPAGPFTREAGFWGYNEICTQINQGGWSFTVDPYYKAPYMSKGNLWIGFDDSTSLREKTKYAMSKGLAGAMIWSLETDDFTGSCNGIPFILLKTIVSTLNGGVIPTPPTPDPNAPTTPTKAPTTTPAPPPTDLCQREGFNRDPNNCAIFYQCVNNGQGGWTVYTNTCPSGLFFDLNSNTCTWPDQVEGCGASATTTTTAAPAPSTTAAPAPSTSVAPGPVTTTTPIVTDAPSTDNCVPSTTTIISTPPPTPPTPGTTLVPHPICTSDGYFREPSDCAVFYQCIANTIGGWTMYTYRCSTGTVFDESKVSCTWPYLVPGCEDYPALEQN